MASRFLPISLKDVNLTSITRSRRLRYLLGIGAGLVLFGFLSRFFLRRTKKPIARSKAVSVNANGSLPASNERSITRGHSPSIPERPSSMLSTRKKKSSMSASTSGNNLQWDRPTVSFKQDALVVSGIESLVEAIRTWERAVNTGDAKILPVDINADKEMLEALEKVLDKAYQLQDDVNSLMRRYFPDATDNFSIASGGYATPVVGYSDVAHHSTRRTLSVLSDDSFMSALEDLLPAIVDLDLALREPLNLSADVLLFFQEGLRQVHLLNVPYRVLRTEFVKCKSDDEFIAKLFCLRSAFTRLLQAEEKREWLANIGRTMLSDLLRNANKDPTGFQKAYDELLLYARNTDNWDTMMEELRARKVVEFSFYDVVLDFIFMDAFDDLAHPPASVIAVAQNRFLSSSFKESTLSAVVWSVIKAKRTRLLYSDGFISHFYSISEEVSPTFAWGFLGTDEMLKDLLNYFKSQLCNFLIDIFNFERVRYTNVEDLADDIWEVCEKRAMMTLEKLNEDVIET